MREFYFDKKKIVLTYGIFIILGIIVLTLGYFRDKETNQYFYIFILISVFYFACSIIRRVSYKDAVVTITSDCLIVRKINFIFILKTIEIPFNQIWYITTDVEEYSKTFYLKTKDDKEYKFNFSLLDTSHEGIVLELKTKCKSLIDGGVYKTDEYDGTINKIK